MTPAELRAAANQHAADKKNEVHITTDKAAIDKTAADKLAADKRNEVQIAADQRLATEELSKTPVIVEGDEKLGGPFSIHGSGFGSSGTLTIGGRLIPTTKWSDVTIKGQTPAGVKGAVVLTTAKGVRHGTFPHEWPVVVETTTTTVKTVPAKR